MYSVLVNKRPIKFGFLVNPKITDWQAQLDAIWEYNLDKWGGRFNTIIPTDCSKIERDWWQFFKKIDPDYVIATSDLSDELKDQIKTEVCPVDIELPRPNRSPDDKPQIFTYNDTIQVIPTPSNIAKLSRNPFLEPQLVVFRCGHNPDEDVKRFILRNFGEYSNAHYWIKTLERVNCLELSVSNKTELIEALRQIGKPPGNYVYPIQISAMESPGLHVENEYDHSYDVFGLVVGDTFEDQIFSWHKVFYSLTGLGRLNHLWLPAAFANDLEIMEALGTWLRGMTEKVHLFSLSVLENELNEIGERLDGPKTARPVLRGELYKSATSYQRFTFPEFSKGHTYSFWDRFSYPLSPPKEADYYRAYGVNEEFEIKSPTPSEGLREKGHWMAEVFIEADKARFYNEKFYYGQTSSFWWQLPRKNYLAIDIFKEKARVNSKGIPTIQLPAKNPQLKFQLPDEGKLLRKCVLGDIRGKMLGEVKRKTPDIEWVEFSNIGKYLLGFLEVFGGLAFAHGVLSERYWRNMFDALSGKDPVKDQKMLDRVKGKLRNKMKSGLTATERINGFENLAPFVIQLAKEITATGETKVFNDFQKEARIEHEEFKKEEDVDYEFDENAVREGISRMLETGVLQMGFEQKCPRCGSINWFLIDEVSQNLTCDGCRYNFSMPAEPAISYRLSSLVRRGIFTHGLIPVVLVLGQLLKDSHASFFFTPSLDLFTQISNEPLEYKLIGDLDIVCIKDGEFIIGEIKEDQARFELEQSLKLAEVAEAIGADILLFSSLEKEQSNRTKEMISKVKEKLKDSKVQAGWYQLGEEIFEPSRMDH
jgi:phage FluMu protein Com